MTGSKPHLDGQCVSGIAKSPMSDLVHSSLPEHCVFCQAEDGIRNLVRSRGLGDVYKRQTWTSPWRARWTIFVRPRMNSTRALPWASKARRCPCLLYTSDAADERSSVDLGGRRIIKKKIELSIAHRCVIDCHVMRSGVIYAV